jgi:nitrous oxidase accessory protein
MVLGLTVDARGGRYDMQDAAIAVRADDVQVRGVRIENAVFGILSDRANRLTITDNEISGQSDVPLGVRGDGIRLWETRSSLIARNHLWDGRDLVVWYSPNNRFEDNLSEGGRYGMHFMHASDNVVRRSRFLGNVVGVFAMYSHQILIEDSDFIDCSSAGGMGVGIKDSGNVTVRRSRFVHDATGVYIDNSPSTRGEHNLIERNVFRLNDAAVVFHANATGNTLAYNSFASNRDQVLVEGGGDALAAHFQSNDFDDYAGYDLDGDDLGDVPYEIRSLASSLGTRYPALGFFRGTAASDVLEALGHIIPLFAPRTLIVDAQPSMRDRTREARHEH